MEAQDQFIKNASLICEPTRAKILWKLLDGKAYTATELSNAAEISITSASNHLTKLLLANMLKVEMQGRHRYYSFHNSEIAHVVEALALLTHDYKTEVNNNNYQINDLSYCRSCYDHLAGFVGVKILETLILNKYLIKFQLEYLVTETGWEWLKNLDISKEDFKNTKRSFARGCLDWSERKPHLAGQLGAVLLKKVIEKQWFRKLEFSRALTITTKGRQEMYKLLGIDF